MSPTLADFVVFFCTNVFSTPRINIFCCPKVILNALISSNVRREMEAGVCYIMSMVYG
jgi:hypothetical protein